MKDSRDSTLISEPQESPESPVLKAESFLLAALEGGKIAKRGAAQRVRVGV